MVEVALVSLKQLFVSYKYWLSSTSIGKKMNIKLLFLLTFLLMGFNCLLAQDPYFKKRKEMVNTQLQDRGIRNPATLYAMLNVARHQFVPLELVEHAYSDTPLPIGYGQTISQPYIVAFMTETLNLRSSDRVLEIGTGSGYQAAVLGKIVDSVYSIEIVEELAASAKNRLEKLDYGNVMVKWGDGYHGWPQKAPFDAIMVTAGADSVPQPLLDQLKIGGRMIIPVRTKDHITQLVKVTKKKVRIVSRKLIPVRFVPFTRKN